MNRIVKAAILATASVAAVIAPISMTTASAGDWGHRGGWGHHRHGWDRPHYRHRNRSGDALAAGAIGLAAGALIGSALSQPRYVEEPRVIYQPRPAYNGGYYPAAPRRVVTYQRSGGFEPWTREWYRYCADRYRSFNPQTGTYRGYDGADHFCTAN
ncbi:BA14K family protein [Phyllobacterium phragmitis]|uniref:Lectin-like protein BA14k n=1 Tax=Phyllobacterium phragmitis TaxID=2670329 RepID=A0A2S9IXK9_9HYPH|nr:BA14K family protein [Phyllobacterium phragmitis]PRD45259.1 BA14K family protein [Phyllobacterium phragmitis]